MNVLRYLSIQSPQAAHYLDILTSLSNAMERRCARDSAVGKNRYVSKIFSLDQSADNHRLDQEEHWSDLAHQGRSDTVAEAATSVTGEAVQMAWEEEVQAWPLGQYPVTDLCLDWESLDMSLWNDFPHSSSS